MKAYTDLLRKIRTKGRLKKNRTGVDTLSIFGAQIEFDLDDGFPLVVERPIFFNGVCEENLWFIDGTCNNEDLRAVGVNFWSKWALAEDWTEELPKQLSEMAAEYLALRQKDLPEGQTLTMADIGRELETADQVDTDAGKPTVRDPKNAKTADELEGGMKILREAGIQYTATHLKLPKGYLGPIYGKLWRTWIGHDGRVIDQLSEVLSKLASDNPKLRYSRALIVTAFNPTVLPSELDNAETNIKNGKQALAACHTMFQLCAEPLTAEERYDLLRKMCGGGEPIGEASAYWENYQAALDNSIDVEEHCDGLMAHLTSYGIPTDQLSLQLYQRKHNCALAA
jgi:thymidylate synthase